MDILEGILAKFADDANEMDYGVRAFERIFEGKRVENIANVNFRIHGASKTVHPKQRFSSNQNPNGIARVMEAPDNFLPYETGSSCHEDFHTIRLQLTGA
jgi:hypothetical protein